MANDLWTRDHVVRRLWDEHAAKFGHEIIALAYWNFHAMELHRVKDEKNVEHAE